MKSGGCWNPLFISHFNNWEVEDAKRLLSWLYKKKVVVEMDDRVQRVERKNGDFFVKSM